MIFRCGITESARKASVRNGVAPVQPRPCAASLQARLWASVGYKELSGGVWNQVTRFLARDRKLSLIESARLFALVNATMQDGVQTAQAS